MYPRLLAKHHADVGRMSGLLTIPAEMNLGLYLDMRVPSVSCPSLFFLLRHGPADSTRPTNHSGTTYQSSSCSTPT